MDGMHFMEGRDPVLSPAGEVAAALAAGRSVAVVGPGGSEPFLALAGQVLRARGARVLPAGPPLDLPALLEQIAATSPAPEQAALERGYELLTEPDPAGGRTVLLVRDAHLLPEQTLRYLDMALRTCPQLQLVLAGQPALAELLALPGFTALGRHLAVRVALPGPELAGRSEPEPPRAGPPEPAARVEPLPRRPAAVPVRARRSWRPLALAGALAAGVAGLAVVARPPTAPMPGVPMPPAPVVADAAPSPAASAPVTPVPVVAVAPAAPVAVAEAPAPATPEPPVAAPAPAPAAVATAPAAPEPAGLPEPVPAAPASTLAGPPKLPVRTALATPPRTPDLPRAERAAAPMPNDRRCRSIVQRAQLGDVPDHDDLQFLRNGCR